MKTILAICAIATIALFLAVEAWGHDDAAWIQEGGYKGGALGNVGCCGPSDCSVVFPAAVRWNATSVTIVLEDGTEFETPTPGVHPSRDWNFWLCRSYSGVGQGRCLFIPSAAMR